MNSTKSNNLIKIFIIQFFLLITISGELMSNSLPKYYTKTLENGLQIVAIPMKNGSGVISTDVFYKVGSRNEKMGKSGIAHMLEHLNFKSTKNLKSGEFDEIVKGFGGVNNASTSFDYTHYYIKSASKNMDKEEILYEMSDLWYHCLVLLAYHNITPDDLLAELMSRRNGGEYHRFGKKEIKKNKS